MNRPIWAIIASSVLVACSGIEPLLADSSLVAAKSPAEVADLYFATFVKAQPGAVKNLASYLKSGDGQIDERAALATPKKSCAMFGNSISKVTLGSKASKAKALDAMGSAAGSALTHMQCRAETGEIDDSSLGLRSDVSYRALTTHLPRSRIKFFRTGDSFQTRFWRVSKSSMDCRQARRSAEPWI